MKRIFSLFCALCLAANLTACSGGAGTDGAAADGTDASSDSQTASSDSQTVTEEPANGTGSSDTAPDGVQPPDVPDGERPDAPPDGSGGERPDAPPDGPGGERPDAPPDGSGGGPGGGFGGSGTVNQGTAAHTIDTETTDASDSYTSSGDDENALRIDGVTAILDKVAVDKSGGDSSNTEDGDFYGLNAAVLATNSARLMLKNSTVRSSVTNGNGVFSYGTGTEVHVENTEITTTGDHSGGIQTTGGGKTEAFNLTIDTSGSSSAAIRTDRGGGEVEVDGGIYVTHGLNSPAVYSTADIEVQKAVLTAENSEALVVEGRNSIELENCAVSGNMSDRGSSADINIHNVMLYQSMSGDAETGTSRLSMDGGSLSCGRGDMFFVTNTRAVIELEGVRLANADAAGRLLVVSGSDASRGWGTAGSNGAQVSFSAENQTLEGDMVVDSISTLSLELEEGTVFTGTVQIVDNAQGGAAVSDNAVVTVEDGAVWKLTGDSTVSRLDVERGGSIDFNGFTITDADGRTYSAS